MPISCHSTFLLEICIYPINMKLIKFDLPINGTKVKDLEELRDNLTDEILTLARSSQLERWLRTRQLLKQAEAVAKVVKSEGTDKGLFLALCKVLEVEAHPDDVKAIFEKPPAPGKFISGARYFQLYEDLKNSMEKKEDVKKSSDDEVTGKIVSGSKVFKVVTASAEFFDIVFWNKLKLGGIGFWIENIFVKQGAHVVKGSLIMEVKFGGSVARIYSPVRGVVEEIFTHIGMRNKIGDKLISISEIKS